MKDAGKKYMQKRNAITGKVVPFERDAGFYLQKGVLYYRKNKTDKALRLFQKAVQVDPGNPFNHYNLACVLCKLGRLEEANRVFLHIIKNLDPAFADCYFLLAINYGLMEDLGKSREYLTKYLQIDPEGEMSFEAMDLLDSIDEDAEFGWLPSYAERDFFMERIMADVSDDDLGDLYRSSKGFRAALNKRLYHGSDEFKEEILRFYGILGTAAARKVLRDFVKNPWVKERFRQLALLELKKLGETQGIQVFTEGRLKEISLDFYPLKKPLWRTEWQRVLDCTTANMRQSNCYDEGFFDDVKAIWLDFINTLYPVIPSIKKEETWAAALEYSLARFHYLDLTQKELAAEYGVSVSSVSSKYKEINKALQIDEKAYWNMLACLKKEFKEP